jgi:4-amino-4-deoxy-L-arabinose transferase-like glycosyltransferase
LFPLFRIWIWPAWLAFALAFSIPLFRRELDYTHPPAKLAGLIALVVLMGVWIWLRRKWRRAELWILAGALIVPALVREPRATLVAVAMSASALAFGRCACGWLKLPMRGRVEEVVTSAALGFSAWIAMLIALGSGHALYAPVIGGLIAIAIVFCRRGLIRLLRCAMEAHGGWNQPDVLTGIQTFAILIVIGAMHLVMLTPSIYFDSFATHLAAANYYSLHHTLEPVPFLRYSGFPQGFELLMSAAALLAGQPGEQMISPVFLMLTLAALYALARDLGASRPVGIVGAVFGIAIPAIAWSGSLAKNDLPLAFLLLFALLGAVRYSNTRAPGWLYAVAFVAAGAQNVKLSAIIAIAPLAILLLLACWPRVREIAIALAVFLLFSAYFPVRNQRVFGSAIYPEDLYAVGTPGVVEDLKSPPIVRAERLASLPWRLQFHGTWGFDGQNDTPLGFFFLLFLPACLWMRRSDWTKVTLGGVFFAACYLLAWGLTVPIVRYAAAPIGMLVLGLSLGLVRTLRVAPGWLKVLLLTMVIYCHVYNWSVMASLGVRMQRIQLLAGNMSADAFLRLMLKTYPSAVWIRDHARPGEQTLSVGNFALAYMGDPGLVKVILEETGPFPVAIIRSELARTRYRYLLLPREVDPEQVFAGQAHAAALESTDERYLVFRLE